MPRIPPNPACAISRRQMLARAASGFGALAASVMLAEDGLLAGEVDKLSTGLHHAAKAKSVIFLYMDGGPSQVDTFDPKPRLTAENGQPFKMKMEPTQFNNNGATLACPWRFNRYGECGAEISDLFPHVAQHADDLAIVRSMTSRFSEHTSANYFLHTGIGIQGRPSMGAWFGYGLGTECRDLPEFIVLNGGLIPPGGLDNFNSGFLPATHQASLFADNDPPVPNVARREPSAELQRNKLALLAQLDKQLIDRWWGDGGAAADPIESAIANYELAYRMQAVVPELADLSGESETSRRAYGLDAKTKGTATFGRQCLLARRLVERGVRFIELTCPSVGHDRWDQHSNLKQGHEENALAVDQPIGALLADLKERGLFEQTLLVWAGEFGRTPFAQGADGRDHNPFGFSIWLAGGGVKGGVTYGATDEYGYKVIENRLEIHDLHATMLHLLGVDHTRLTFRFSGRDMRLTDVHGHVVREILS